MSRHIFLACLELHPPAQVLYTVGVLYKIINRNAITETYQQLEKVEW